MKKVLCVFLFFCITIVLLPGQASAALTGGAWNSNYDFIQTGTWSQVVNGTYPDFAGSVGEMHSSSSGVGAWSFQNWVTGPTATPLGSGLETGGHYQDFRTNLSGGTSVFTFSDGLTYTPSFSNFVLQYRMHFDSSNNFVGLDNILWQGGGGVVDPATLQAYHMNITYGNAYASWRNNNTQGGPVPYAAYDLTPVPVPAAVWLFGSGILGLFGIRRREG